MSLADHQATPSVGVIFCATGAGFAELACRAAASCRAAMPAIAIDLFTDQDIHAPDVDRVVRIEDVWRRSKIDAMLASRFEKTVFLDADTVVRASIEDVFELLDRFELCGAADQFQNAWGQQAIWRVPIPQAFPQINTGVLGYRLTPKVRALFSAWAHTVRAERLKRDQVVFRELLWDSDVRFATLPGDYNFMAYNLLTAMTDEQASPRVLHAPRLNHHLKFKTKRIATLDALLGLDNMQRLAAMSDLWRRICRNEKRRRNVGQKRVE